MPAITLVPRAIDTDKIIDGARAALLANSTIATALNTATYPKRIANEVVEEGTTAPYIVLSLASVVYASSYNDPMLSALLDVSCYTEGASTTMVRSLMLACLTALIDTAWTVSGLTLTSANMEESGAGIRQITSVTSGVITRGRQATIRIRAEKTS